MLRQRWFALQLPVLAAIGSSALIDTPSGRLAVGSVALVIEAGLAWMWLGKASDDGTGPGSGESDASPEEAIRLAGQVIHDLRPPLTALEHVEPDLKGMPETAQRLVKSATQKIHELVDRLQKERARLRGETPASPSLVAGPSLAAPETKVLLFTKNSLVVVLDDDADIHEAWKKRFDAARLPQYGVEVRYFSRPGDFTDFVTEDPAASGDRPTLYLVDHDFQGYTVTGLGLIESLNLASRSILVTNRSDDPEVVAKCARLKLRLMPKDQMRTVPLTLG